MSSNNRKMMGASPYFSICLIGVLLLFVIGMLSVSSQAQLPAKRVSRFGVNRDAQPTQGSHGTARPRTVYTPSGITFAFGLVDFPRSPDSTAQGLNRRKFQHV
jgi:hypothetical protein